MNYCKSIITALGLLTAAAATATPLTPEQALAAAMGNAPARVKSQSSATADTYTLRALDGTPTVYVFSQPQSAGFIIVAADDEVTPLLGYSDTSAFDPDNIAPATKWWLEQYSQSVAAIVAGTSVSSPLRAGAVNKAQRTSIDPLCTTQWNQDAPYYNECPRIGVQRAYTGCVATAMAQVMKVHNYPPKGIGEHSYSFTYNNRTYTDQFDFGNTTFDWDNMLDSYAGSSTSTQKSAVATLMHACGVAADMSYGLDGSGAYEQYALHGLITYLGYDRGASVEFRDWYSAEAWDELVYDQLRQGLPLIYCGNDGESGHAFVCDGYYNSYYHINWGWGGAADGYFRLADLNPYTQGIGGGSGQDGFNYGQTIIANLRPDAGTTNYTYHLWATGLIKPGKYTRSASARITLADAYYNLVSPTMPLSKTGAKLIYADGTESYLLGAGYDGTTVDLWGGVSGDQFRANKFPVGSYNVVPVFSANGTDWCEITYDRSEVDGRLHFEVTSTSIVISVVADDNFGDNPEDPQTPEPGELSAELVSIEPAHDVLYIGQSYQMTFDVKSTGYFSGEIFCMICDKAYSEIITYYSAAVTFTEAGTARVGWCLSIPDYTAEGDYILTLATLDDNNYFDLFDVDYSVTIAKMPVSHIEGDVNFDDEVNIADAQRVLNIMSGTYVPETRTTGDVNADGLVNIADVQRILNIMSGEYVPAKTFEQTVYENIQGAYTLTSDDYTYDITLVGFDKGEDGYLTDILFYGLSEIYSYTGASIDCYEANDVVALTMPSGQFIGQVYIEGYGTLDTYAYATDGQYYYPNDPIYAFTDSSCSTITFEEGYGLVYMVAPAGTTNFLGGIGFDLNIVLTKQTKASARKLYLDRPNVPAKPLTIVPLPESTIKLRE